MKIFAGLGVAWLTLWAGFAIYFSNLPGAGVRAVAAAGFVGGTILLFWRVRPFRRAGGSSSARGPAW